MKVLSGYNVQAVYHTTLTSMGARVEHDWTVAMLTDNKKQRNIQDLRNAEVLSLLIQAWSHLKWGDVGELLPLIPPVI